ncbi:MAG TPA: hypothetical protein VNM90_20715 [Haliangium sp.]|nr:hypothetical protein [Haliangium sp.]
MVLIIVSFPALARGQTEEEAATREIPVHPSVMTILQLPDDVELARFNGPQTGMMWSTKLRELLYIQPRAGLRAGTEVSLTVHTATLRRRFRLRVVEHARDAWQNVVVLEPEAEPAPAASASPGALTPAPPEPLADSKPTEERAHAVLRSRRVDVSVHFVGSLGFTGLDVAGQQPFSTRQPHAGFGARLMVTRPGAWWVLEANIGGDWPGGPMSLRKDDGTPELITLDGPWLRAEAGMRAQLGGTKWNPSLSAALGAQAHLRRTETPRDRSAISETMPLGAVLTLGIGLQRRARVLLLGLDFQVRKGWPDGYHSIAVLWTAGSFLDLDQANEP